MLNPYQAFVDSLSKASRLSVIRRSRRFRRPRWVAPPQAACERLEDRTLLSAITVDYGYDAVDANPGDGIAADAHGRTTLRAAIMEANALGGSHTLHLNQLYYSLSRAGAGENSGRYGDLDITADVTIIGNGVGETTIDGRWIDRVFDVQRGGALHLVDVEVIGGKAPGASGEIRERWGGAIRSDFYTTVVVEQSLLRGNIAANFTTGGYGSGGAIQSSGNLSILESRLEGNSASNDGGAIYINGSGASTTIRNTAFVDNTAPGGGAIYNLHRMTIENSTFVGNSAGDFDGGNGGAINNNGAGDLMLVNSTITGNSSGYGGGIYNSGTITARNNTVAGNSATNGGGFFTPYGMVTLANSIVALNSATYNGQDIQGVITSLGENLIGDTSDASGFVATDLLGLDPQLAPLAMNGGLTPTMALLPGSPAIDGAKTSPAPTTDQRGTFRPQGLAADIGAYELAAEDNPGASNILVTAYPTNDGYSEVREYTTAGVLVRVYEVPETSGHLIRDLVVDAEGNVQIFDGTFTPLLTTLDPLTGTVTHQALPAGWSTENNGTYGGIDTFGDYVFVTDMLTGNGGVGQGIIRLDQKTGESIRFGTDYEFTDLCIGLDGLLYGLDEIGEVHVFDLASLSELRSIRLDISYLPDYRGIAVNAAGDIFASGWDGRIHRLSGETGRRIDLSERYGELGDIDIRSDGTIIASNRAGDVLVTDETLDTVWIFSTSTEIRSIFVAFGTADTSPNQQPTAYSAIFEVDEDASVSGTVSGSDPDGNSLTILIVNGPSNGSLEFAADGSFTYTPNANCHGSDFFTFRVYDGWAYSDIATASVTVLPVNDAPVALDAAVSMTAGTTFAGQVAATDIDGDNLTYRIVAGATNGTLLLNANGSFSYTPYAGFVGTDSFTFTAFDGITTSEPSAITIAVAPLRATIDVDHTDSSNTIDIARDSTITVAIYGGVGLDVQTIGIDTLTFGRTGSEASRYTDRKGRSRYSYTDINGDGILDLVVTFDVKALGLTADDVDTAVELTLRGTLADGTLLEGGELVNITATTGKGGGGKGGGNGKGNR